MVLSGIVKYLSVALGASLLSLYLIAYPRLQLVEERLQMESERVVELQGVNEQHITLIESQQTQLTNQVEWEKSNRELLTLLSSQSNTQHRILKELKTNNETVKEYLLQPVPLELGRLYKRTETTNSSGYRQHSSVPTNVVRTTK